MKVVLEVHCNISKFLAYHCPYIIARISLSDIGDFPFCFFLCSAKSSSMLNPSSVAPALRSAKGALTYGFFYFYYISLPCRLFPPTLLCWNMSSFVSFTLNEFCSLA